MQKMQFYNNNNYNNVSVVSILILLNVVVYCLFQANIFNFIGDSHYYIKELFCMNSDALVKSQIWRFITYMFLHENIKHLIINIILIYCFGSIIEKIFGGIYFLIIYIFIGLFASILYIISMKLLDINIYYINIIGSGPLIYGMISVSGLLFPNNRIFIFFRMIF